MLDTEYVKNKKTSSTLFQLFLPDPLGLLLFLAIEGVSSLLLALFLALFEALLPLLDQALLELLQFFLKNFFFLKKVSFVSFTHSSALEKMKTSHEKTRVTEHLCHCCCVHSQRNTISKYINNSYFLTS